MCKRVKTLRVKGTRSVNNYNKKKTKRVGVLKRWVRKRLGVVNTLWVKIEKTRHKTTQNHKSQRGTLNPEGNTERGELGNFGSDGDFAVFSRQLTNNTK